MTTWFIDILGVVETTISTQLLSSGPLQSLAYTCGGTYGISDDFITFILYWYVTRTVRKIIISIRNVVKQSTMVII